MTIGVVNTKTVYVCSGCLEEYDAHEDAMECFFQADCAGADGEAEEDAVDEINNDDEEIEDAEIEEEEN